MGILRKTPMEIMETSEELMDKLEKLGYSKEELKTKNIDELLAILQSL